MSRSARYLEQKLLSDACFLYTAFAPMVGNCRDSAKRVEAAAVLVKVGVSATPMNRLVTVHHGCPFRVHIAAFAPAGFRRMAEKAESRILTTFAEYRTRGEWLMLPNTEEVRKDFAHRAKSILADVTGRPTVWTKVTGNKLSEHALQRMKKTA